ncbi:hypothetical protein NC652_008713 [Populus alba x Populus x berolinensis]|nr:hypothetical protein NC652_008713 [Populus alba x Populus x berolinensis]
MENGRIMNSSVIQDGFMMKTHDEEEPSKIHNDIITNCLKNQTRNASAISALPINIESQTVCLATARMTGAPQERKIHSENSVSLCCGETYNTKLGRRDWKARGKKNIKYQKLSREFCLYFKVVILQVVAAVVSPPYQNFDEGSRFCNA